MMKLPVVCGVFACLVVVSCGAAFAAGPAKVDFNRDIRPLLSNTCYKCHGFDDKERKAGLRLDTPDGALAKTESGMLPIVPGKSAESEVFLRITSDDPNAKMPPANSGKTLTPAQIDLIRRWIDEGAEFKGHWSLQTPTQPTPPAVKHAAAVRNPIDNFILSRLEAEGIEPAPEADKLTLIRRVTLDLTGLPPTPKEIDDFVADQAPNAYETLVNRLLDNPRYGEQMARYWLDLARYGDTHGLHLDNERALWLYREWVIKAFNRNLPFDQFTIQQVGGDLLENPTEDQLIASGFNRCNVTTGEGGSIDEEVYVRYAIDRVETMSTVFLGMTLGCAVCHNHKFDPVSQKEFYQLYDFYNRMADKAMDGNALAPPPLLKVTTQEVKDQLAALDKQLAEVRTQIDAAVAKIEYTEPAGAAEASTEPKDFVWIDDELPAGAKPEGNPPGWVFGEDPEFPVHSGKKSHKRQSQGLSQHFFTGATAPLKVGEGDKFFTYVYLDPLDPPKEIMLQFNDGAWEHRALWGEDVIQFGEAGKPSRFNAGALPKAGEWTRIEVDCAKVGLNPGALINGWAFTQHDGTVYWDQSGIVTKTPQNGQGFDSLAVWSAYEKSLQKSTLPPPVLAAIKVEADKRDDAQKALIRSYFLENVYAKTKPQFDELHKKSADLTKQKTDLDAAIPMTLISQDLPPEQARPTHILIRGEYTKKAEKVTAAVPSVFPPLPEGAPANRLGLAKWLVDPKHPLTARVTVNRYWQQYFGRGIVKTAEDFGTQGEWPTNPALLDWLATEFIRTGWDVKGMQKLIVMSGTYRQASRVTPELVQRDPENILLARGPRFRMDAEMVRDNALFISGLLVEKLGGRSVKPYQPQGLWEAVGFVGSNTSAFKQDAGEALYRRSMYTFWKRTSPPPSMMTFDAPSRENCVARRARTNTPLQALVLMNDAQYVEAARQFAARIIKTGGDTPDARLQFALRTAAGRPPTEKELGILRNIYTAQLADYQAAPEEATKLLTVGDSPRDMSLNAPEHAAWTMIANLILNLDEVVTKE